jgi:sugar phosphate isomerase/epimerase
MLLVGNRPHSHAGTPAELAKLVAEVGSPHLRVSLDPASLAQAGGSPFYGGLYRGSLRRLVDHIELRDVVAADGRVVPPGQGNAELIEIISNLRCRTFQGTLCLWPLPGGGADGIQVAAAGFWDLMESI